MTAVLNSDASHSHRGEHAAGDCLSWDRRRAFPASSRLRRGRASAPPINDERSKLPLFASRACHLSEAALLDTAALAGQSVEAVGVAGSTRPSWVPNKMNGRKRRRREPGWTSNVISSPAITSCIWTALCRSGVQREDSCRACCRSRAPGRTPGLRTRPRSAHGNTSSLESPGRRRATLTETNAHNARTRIRFDGLTNSFYTLIGDCATHAVLTCHVIADRAVGILQTRDRAGNTRGRTCTHSPANKRT